MSDLSRLNPTGRFTGLADGYARYRPSYPDAAIDYILARCGLRAGSLLVDVGCGTGISSRLFAQRGLTVIGIEPNAEMRAKAQAEQGSGPPLLYQDGKAEATGLPDASADAVLAAQAFHWFESEAALREFYRILEPGGWVILMWNERDERDPFTAAYGAAIRSFPGAAKLEGARARAGEPLLSSPLFTAGERVVFPSAQAMNEEEMLGRAFSASYAPREPDQVQELERRLREHFARFQHHGQVALHYETSVYRARRDL